MYDRDMFPETVDDMVERLLWEGLNPEEIGRAVERIMPGRGENVFGMLVEMAEEEEGCDG